MAHPATGPISPEEMQRLAALPYGAALAELQKHDPLWGLVKSDTPIKSWKVTVQKAEPMTATIFVDAPNEANARAQVNAMDDGDFDWDRDGFADDFEIWNVEGQS